MIALFVLTGMRVPTEIATFVDNTIVKVLLYVVALYLVSLHPVLGGVALFGVYELIRRSELATGSGYLPRYLPSQLRKDKELASMNHREETLEEEMVKKMTPYVSAEETVETSVKPVLAKAHSAGHI